MSHLKLKRNASQQKHSKEASNHSKQASKQDQATHNQAREKMLLQKSPHQQETSLHDMMSCEKNRKQARLIPQEQRRHDNCDMSNRNNTNIASSSNLRASQAAEQSKANPRIKESCNQSQKRPAERSEPPHQKKEITCKRKLCDTKIAKKKLREEWRTSSASSR